MKYTEVLVDVTNLYIKEFGLYSPECINSGHCFNWAWIVERLIPTAKISQYTLTGSHAWIMIDGLHYDSEHVTGKTNFWEIPLLESVDANDIEFNVSKYRFLEYWSIYGRYNWILENRQRYLRGIVKEVEKTLTK